MRRKRRMRTTARDPPVFRTMRSSLTFLGDVRAAGPLSRYIIRDCSRIERGSTKKRIVNPVFFVLCFFFLRRLSRISSRSMARFA